MFFYFEPLVELSQGLFIESDARTVVAIAAATVYSYDKKFSLDLV